MKRERLALVLAAMLCATAARADEEGPADTDDALPSGHPDVPPAGADSAGAGGHGAGNDMFQVPEDGAIEDPRLPAGTVLFQILDADGKATKPNTEVTLGVIYNSVAKGESRKRLYAKTDPTGHVKFDGLDSGSGVAYRMMVLDGMATFSAPPFQLPAKGGMSGTLHVYPLETDVERAKIVAQIVLYPEVKDDRVQVQEAITFYNVGKSAWVPKDVIIPLPPEFTAFSAQQGMTDVGVDAVPKRGVRLRGTFGPGEHTLEFRWQLPYGGEPEVRFEAGTGPHTAAARVLAPSSRNMELVVDGFPAARTTKDGMGQRALITEKQVRREEAPLRTVRVQITGLPSEGPGKLIATALAACGVAIGIVLGARKPPQRDRKAERGRILADLEALERAHAAGDVGPKTYERARRDLLDALARTFAGEAKPAEGKDARSAER